MSKTLDLGCDPEDFEYEDFEDEITGEYDVLAADEWCAECNGTGYVVYDSEQDEDEDECPICRGTGVLVLLP